MHLPTLPRVLLKSVIRVLMVAVFLGIPLALVWARVVGIGFGWPEKVSDALSSQAIRTTIGKLSFDLVDGLVAEDVVVSSAGGGGKPLARINRVAVSPSIDELLHRRIVIERVTLDGARAEIPMEKGTDNAVLGIDNVKADVALVDDQIRIARLEAEVEGIRIRGSGRLRSPGGLALPRGGAAEGGSLAAWTKAVALLNELRFPGNPPTITFELAGDLDDPSGIVVDPVVIASGPIVGEDWRVEGIEGSARFAAGSFSLEKVTVRGKDNRRLLLWASSDGARVDFEAESSLDPFAIRGLVPALKSLKESLSMPRPPTLGVRGHFVRSDPGGTLEVVGMLRAEAFAFRGVECDSLETGFAYRDGTFFAREIRLAAQGGSAMADLLMRKGDFRLRGRTDIKPTAFLPALDAKARQTLSLLEFRDRPEVSFEFRGPGSDFREMRGNGKLRLGRTAMRGSWIDSAIANVEVSRGAVTYRDFQIQQGDGRGTGSFTYDFAGQQVRLEGVRSTLEPVGVMMWVDPKIADSIRAYRFTRNPSVRADGVVHMKDIARNDLQLTVDAPQGLSYDLIGRTLRFGDTDATVRLDGSTVRVRVSRARLMGGEVGFSADVSIDPARPEIKAETDVRRVDFAKLTKLYFNYDNSKGVCSGRYAFEAPLGRESLMKGRGSIRVEDGNVFAIPFLGPLSDILNKIIKGGGHDAARLATADFAIANETVSTENLVIEGSGFSLYGNGDIFFMKDRMDMSVRINARGIPGIVLYPVSKLFEYVSTGKASRPEWRPKLIPRIGNKEP